MLWVTISVVKLQLGDQPAGELEDELARARVEGGGVLVEEQDLRAVPGSP